MKRLNPPKGRGVLNSREIPAGKDQFPASLAWEFPRQVIEQAGQLDVAIIAAGSISENSLANSQPVGKIRASNLSGGDWSSFIDENGGRGYTKAAHPRESAFTRRSDTLFLISAHREHRQGKPQGRRG